MGSYILRRMLIMLPSVLGISVVLFTILALAPGDPFEELRPTPPCLPRCARCCAPNSASMIRCGSATSLARRDAAGRLLLLRQPRRRRYADPQRVPVTLAIIGASQVLALMVALPVGIYSAMRPYSLFDRIASTFAFVGFSPTFSPASCSS